MSLSRARHPSRHVPWARAAGRDPALRLRPPRRVRRGDGGRDRAHRPGRARRAPDARHRAAGRAAGRARAGARAALRAGRRPPRGVDPGVGSERRAVVVETGDGRLLVGPDNGLLTFAADELGGIAAAYAIENTELFLHPVSRTFHGRDVFAPVAAHLADGLEPAAVGPAVDPATLVRIELPPAELEPGHVRATAMAIDRFGNVALSVRGAELERLGLAYGRPDRDQRRRRPLLRAARAHVRRRPRRRDGGVRRLVGLGRAGDELRLDRRHLRHRARRHGRPAAQVAGSPAS